LQQIIMKSRGSPCQATSSYEDDCRSSWMTKLIFFSSFRNNAKQCTDLGIWLAIKQPIDPKPIMPMVKLRGEEVFIPLLYGINQAEKVARYF
jgi:hypothetical protein